MRAWNRPNAVVLVQGLRLGAGEQIEDHRCGHLHPVFQHPLRQRQQPHVAHEVIHAARLAQQVVGAHRGAVRRQQFPQRVHLSPQILPQALHTLGIEPIGDEHVALFLDGLQPAIKLRQDHPFPIDIDGVVLGALCGGGH